MMTTESFPGAAFNEWRLAKENPYILGDFVWTAMDYLGELGIGSWAYGTSEQAALAAKAMSGMQSMADKMFLAMANGVDMSTLMTQGAAQGSESPLSVLLPGFPGTRQTAAIWIQRVIGSRSRTIETSWNGGDEVYADVELQNRRAKRRSWRDGRCTRRFRVGRGPARKARPCKVEAYSGVEDVRLS